MINKDSLKARTHNIAKKLNINRSIVYNRYFFDAFLSRLSISPYRDKFILKGGLYLSSLFGIETRITMDIDFYLKRMSMMRNNVSKIIEEITLLDINDGITFTIENVSDIRNDDQYGVFL